MNQNDDPEVTNDIGFIISMLPNQDQALEFAGGAASWLYGELSYIRKPEMTRMVSSHSVLDSVSHIILRHI